MNKEYEVIPALVKDDGETLTASELNKLAVLAYAKINGLNAFNIGAVSTGKYVDFNDTSGGEPPVTTYYPEVYANYCGRMMHRSSQIASSLDVNCPESIDYAIIKIKERINELLNKV